MTTAGASAAMCPSTKLVDQNRLKKNAEAIRKGIIDSRKVVSKASVEVVESCDFWGNGLRKQKCWCLDGTERFNVSGALTRLGREPVRPNEMRNVKREARGTRFEMCNAR